MTATAKVTSPNDLQSQLSLAYVTAVASAAGFAVQEAARLFDQDGIDVTLLRRGPGGTVRSPKLDVQVKSMGRENPTTDPWSFKLPLKTYEELRAETYQVPRILVVVIVPENPTEWLTHTPDELVLRRCAWWTSLRGAAATTNETSIVVPIPLSQRLDVGALAAIMDRVAQGGLP